MKHRCRWRQSSMLRVRPRRNGYKPTHYRPGETLRVAGGWGEAPRISRQSAYKCGKLISPKHRLPLPPQGRSLVIISVRNWAKTRTGRIRSRKNPNDTIAKRTRGFPACSTVPQPNVPPPDEVGLRTNFLEKWVIARGGLGRLETTHPLSLQRK
jgi:hypothetical protein